MLTPNRLDGASAYLFNGGVCPRTFSVPQALHGNQQALISPTACQARYRRGPGPFFM